MSELAEIAAMAGITVLETPSGDAETLKSGAQTGEMHGEGDNGDVSNGEPNNGDVNNGGDSKTIELSADLTVALDDITEDDLDAEFEDRYTDTDPDYIENLAKGVDIAKPPTLSDFFCRPPRRDNSRGNWNRNRDQGRGGQRGGYRNNRDWESRGGGDNRGYGGGYRDNRQGGYHDNKQGGYRDNRQGGYGDNRQGSYRDNRQGGYDERRGSYNRDRSSHR